MSGGGGPWAEPGFDWDLEEARQAERALAVKEMAVVALIVLLIVARELWLL